MYPGRELNPYFRCGKLDFKSSASTNSATQVCALYTTGHCPVYENAETKNSTGHGRMEF